ncbi:MAG: hypothetical protein GQ574_08815 [Crocinitomix sp.]|nr:hypothetical protein [Crocinitomix sp.]
MSVSDENLAQLFSQARNQQPVANLDETKKAFITATVVAAGGVLATKGLLQLLTTKKWIIMLSTITIITTGTLIVGLSANPKETAENIPSVDNQNSIITVDEPQESFEAVADASSYLEPAIPSQLTEIDHNAVFEPLASEPDFLNENDFIAAEDSLDAEPDAEPLSHAPRLAESTSKIKPYAQRYDITENTTKTDFEKMKREAEKDGIEFTYKAKYTDDKLTKLRLELKIDQEEEDGYAQHVMSNIDIKGSFEYTIAWDNGANGQASNFYCGDTDEFNEEDNDAQGELEESINEFEDMLAELQLEDLIENFDSLSEQMWNNFDDIDWDDIAAEFESFEAEFEEAFEEFKKEDVQKLMEELKESSEEMVKTIQEELRQMQIEIEKEKIEIEKQKEQDEKDKKENKDKENKEDKKDDQEDEEGTRI